MSPVDQDEGHTCHQVGFDIRRERQDLLQTPIFSRADGYVYTRPHCPQRHSSNGFGNSFAAFCWISRTRSAATSPLFSRRAGTLFSISISRTNGRCREADGGPGPSLGILARNHARVPWRLSNYIPSNNSLRSPAWQYPPEPGIENTRSIRSAGWHRHRAE